MAAYSIFFRKSVWKDFDPIPKRDLKRILDRIAALSAEPRPTAREALGARRYRRRQGRYRIVYSVEDDKLAVWASKWDTVRTFIGNLLPEPSSRWCGQESCHIPKKRQSPRWSLPIIPTALFGWILHELSRTRKSPD